MVQLIGQENHEYAIRTIFEMFQHPRLNKQVCLHPPVKTDKALYCRSVRGHSFSTYAKFSEKLTFTRWYAHVRVRIRGLEILVFRKMLCTY